MHQSGGPEPDLTSMRDLLDNDVVAADERPLARVDDVRARWDDDGRLRLEALLFGPQVLAARLWWRLQGPAHTLFRGRFDCSVQMGEVQELGDVIWLRRPAAYYPVGRIERSRLARVLRRLSGPRW